MTESNTVLSQHTRWPLIPASKWICKRRLEGSPSSKNRPSWHMATLLHLYVIWYCTWLMSKFWYILLFEFGQVLECFKSWGSTDVCISKCILYSYRHSASFPYCQLCNTWNKLFKKNFNHLLVCEQFTFWCDNNVISFIILWKKRTWWHKNMSVQNLLYAVIYNPPPPFRISIVKTLLTITGTTPVLLTRLSFGQIRFADQNIRWYLTT